MDNKKSLRPYLPLNGLMLLIGLILLGWIVNHAPSPDPIVPKQLLGLVVAFTTGFLLRGLRRKLFFGDHFSLHQSLSFEIMLQNFQYLNPLLPRHELELEFTSRETGLGHQSIRDWFTTRTDTNLILALVVISIYTYSYISQMIWGILIMLLTIYLIRPIQSCPILKRLLTHLSGLSIWGFEFWLLTHAFADYIPVQVILISYLIFTLLLEFAPIPLGIGAALVPLLFFTEWPALVTLLVGFHLLRVLPILVLSTVYFSRYKFSYSDLYCRGLIAKLHQSHLPHRKPQQSPESEAPLLSIVIPAYNEELRLPGYLEEVRTYLSQQPFCSEIIVVDDGSRDRTKEVVTELEPNEVPIHLLEHHINQGKGATVRDGMLAARGNFVIYADADGATPIAELKKFFPLMEEQAEIIIGSRKLSTEDTDQDRVWLREMMGRLFYLIVNFFAVPGIHDTQCGFKMFRRDTAQAIFSKCHENGWAFDVEVLYLAQLLGYEVHELPVNWHEVPGSKINPLKDAIKMFFATFRIRHNHAGFFR